MGNKTTNSDLTKLEKKFCEEYVRNGGNATEAISFARGTPYKRRETAMMAGSRMYRKDKIRRYLDFLQKKATDNTVMSRREVLQRLTNLGRANMGNLAEWNNKSVKLKDSAGLKKDVLETVQEVSQKSGKSDEIKVKQYDKVKALELLAKHHGVLVEGSEQEDDRPDRGSFEDSISKSIKKL